MSDRVSDRWDGARLAPAAESWVRPALVVLAAAGLVFFYNLGGPGLWDEDEPKNASCGLEMLQRGDWVVPSFNQELRTDKPILIYWCMLVSYRLLGVSEFSARLASAVMALGTVLCTFWLGRMLRGPGTGLWGSLVLSGSLMFVVSARACTPDAFLVCTSTLGIALAVRALVRGGSVSGSAEFPHVARRDWIPVGLALGLAVLAKGPAGFVLPVGVLGLFVLVRRMGVREPVPVAGWWRTAVAWTWGAFHPRAVWRGVVCLRPATLLVSAGLVALPWYVAVGWATDGAWLAGFLGRHNVSRFLEPMENHSGPIFYYVIAIAVGMLPWSVFLPGAMRGAVGRSREQGGAAWGDTFLLCWVGLYVVFFSLARTKLPSYVLPCYPALALLVGSCVDQWARGLAVDRRGLRNGLYALIGVGLVTAVAIPVACRIVLPGEEWLGLVGLIPVAGAGATLVLVARAQDKRGMATLTGMALAQGVVLFGLVAARVDRYQNSEPAVALARAGSGVAPEFGTYDFFRPSLVFYSRSKVHDLASAKEVAEFLERSPRAYVLTRDDQWSTLEGKLPAGVEVLDRRKMFLRRRHDVLLLGRRAGTPGVGETRAARGTSASETSLK